MDSNMFNTSQYNYEEVGDFSKAINAEQDAITKVTRQSMLPVVLKLLEWRIKGLRTFRNLDS